MIQLKCCLCMTGIISMKKARKISPLISWPPSARFSFLQMIFLLLKIPRTRIRLSMWMLSISICRTRPGLSQEKEFVCVRRELRQWAILRRTYVPIPDMVRCGITWGMSSLMDCIHLPIVHNPLMCGA